MATVWVFDTSSIIEAKSSLPRTDRDRVFAALTELVRAGRLRFPREVLAELKRGADRGVSDRAYLWAQEAELLACQVTPTFEDVKGVLEVVPDILDSEKESGVDEADPYVHALARKLREQGVDARVVTEETKNYARKLSLNTACGIIGIPSVPLLGLLRAERIVSA